MNYLLAIIFVLIAALMVFLAEVAR